jgi:hypothetical protein
MLRSYLSDDGAASSYSPQTELLREIFLSSLLELLGDISFLHPEAITGTLIEMIVPLLCIAVQSSNEAVRAKSDSGGGASSYSIVNQAALTTLSRLSLSLGYYNGREFLR